MNAHCERGIGSIRREALDHVLIMTETHARHVLAVHQQHHNEHRPHRARNQLPPTADQQPITDTSSKAADFCAPTSSAVSSTRAAMRLDPQRRLSDPHRLRGNTRPRRAAPSTKAPAAASPSTDSSGAWAAAGPVDAHLIGGESVKCEPPAEICDHGEQPPNPCQ
ncbi:integrase core domain-containing protein [Kitasatospora sp. NPDC018058]|uniref:integrase core domain-containing protein n=1 Tax=Kitasatospora sp. NPDC018058 TaxID=3364025 RepID=UPI0037C1A81D